jgi:dihydrofolate reductase
MDLDAKRRRDVRNASFVIAAVAENGVIGAEGGIPWHCSADMAHFRQTTLGCALVVGRRTFDSLPKSMPGRTIVVVTSRPLPDDANALSAPTFERAVEIAEETGSAAIAFAGGTSIYREALALPWLRIARLTRVDARPEGDATFPEMDASWSTERSYALASKEGQPSATVDVMERMPQTA